MPIAISASEAIEPAMQDERAVAAVLGGDTLGYRELVERYQRLVYAVAWSRLGDATLAEDAAQEAFIRAYKSLPLLGNGAKFSAWITTIARNTAISLGLRHRRELEKRERWALEQPVSESAEVSKEEICTPEMLRQTLAELPDVHRECLVLFYLEGKKGAEAAAALGIPEATLRMRLVRARAVLRERLEAKLDESLEHLQPSHAFVPGVMSALATTTSVKAGGGAGLGTTLLAALGKVLPFKMVTLFVPFACVIPWIGLSWWTTKQVRKNYREPEGFRARLHRDFFRIYMWYFPVYMLAAFVCIHFVRDTFGMETLSGFMGVFALPGMISSARQFHVNRGKYMTGIFLFGLCYALGMIAVGFRLLPVGSLPFVIALPVLFVAFFTSDWGPVRLDYNLFLREAQGMLAIPAGEGKTIGGACLSKAQMMLFARFLGGRFLVDDFLWKHESGSLMLRLAPVWQPVRFTFGAAFFFFRPWKKRSWIEIKQDGSVTSHFGESDEQSLKKLSGAIVKERDEMEADVSTVVENAWRSFRDGDTVEAERMIGQLADTEIFIVPSSRLQSARVTKLILAILLVAGFVFAVLSKVLPR